MVAELTPQTIALNRFGLGARPGEAAPADPRRWLRDQFARYDPAPAPVAALADPRPIVAAYAEAQRDARQARQAPGASAMTPAEADPRVLARRDAAQAIQLAYRQAVNARLNAALAGDAPFLERMVHFWANHFAVSAEKPPVTAFAGAFEAEAIRPHVLGRFETMLLAAERHPAMMIYLDQATSIGPSSPLATRVATRNPERKIGLNENLAREIMELHTLGVRSGYAQADVTEMARAMTGWSVSGYRQAAGAGGGPGDFQFRPQTHEPGARTILGKRYDQPGEEQALAALRDFAAAPATARHIATKLARHFAGDTPPPALVARLEQAFLQSGGDLPTVYRALIEAPEAWAPAPVKFKSPWEWTVSAFRALGTRSVDQAQIAPLMTQLGQPVWRPGSPAGYDDIGSAWAAPDALVRRVEVAQRLVAPVGDRIDARTLWPQLMPGSADPATEQAIVRAESGPTALALLLVSPQFQRR